MKRRDFIRLSSLTTAYLMLPGCKHLVSDKKYAVTILSDHKIGHLVRQPQKLKVLPPIKHDYVVVGGGMAGVTAAYKLRNEDVALYELSDSLGGSSGAHTFESLTFGQGAHYDLAYPNYYGKKVLDHLKELNIISFNSSTSMWEFRDKQYVIPAEKEVMCFESDEWREDILVPELEYNSMLASMSEYAGKMPLPTRLIEEEARVLNKETFYQFLQKKMKVSPEFKERLDYNMLDDWGGKSDTVSALAGIHYYMCRPYQVSDVELFSPAQGNYYFIEKMCSAIDKEKIKCGHLVSKVAGKEGNYTVSVIDGKNETIREVHTQRVVYAGQKHTLPFVRPEDADLFSRNNYAPWLVMNIVLDKPIGNNAFWQNEFISEDASSFLGFVDSKSQYSSNKDTQVLSAYHCFKPNERNELLKVIASPQQFINDSISKINIFLDENISDKVKHVFLKPMGHAMPIPTPGYLFNDANAQLEDETLAYAGVDNGRLPLLFEAIDSGILAAERVNLALR